MKINTQQICTIEIFRICLHKGYVYKEAKKSFFGNTKEGFYNSLTFGFDYVSKEEIEADGKFYCKGKQVLFHPHIEIRMSNGVLKTKFFKNEIELNNYMQQPEIQDLKIIEV